MIGAAVRLCDAMKNFELAHDILAEVTAAVFPAAPVVRLVPLRGGLEASVARITIRDSDRRSRQVVVKHLTAGGRREALCYEFLAPSGVTPSLLGSVNRGDSTYLFLEHVRPVSTWPWRDSGKTRLVLEQLARVHRLTESPAHGHDWDYEAELCSSAAETVAVATEAAAALPELAAGRELRPLRRVAASIGEARMRMKRLLGTTLIHGDVHSANVILRHRAGGQEVVLLDWGRSRTGSPLEDVSSWLLSLATWEPAAARDHDTLFRSYLAAAGHPNELTPEVRDAYWIAAASNVLAGALRYQLAAARETTGGKRARAIAQARAALRVIRRADERRANG